MLAKLLLAFGVMAACVIVHASMVSWLLRRLRAVPVPGSRFWPATFVCIRVAAWIVGCHLIEIGFWALVYLLDPEIQGLETAIYFSAVTYTTTGYGDILLSPDWRMVGGIEALTGILMCGWSAAFFFAVLTRLYRDDRGR